MYMYIPLPNQLYFLIGHIYSIVKMKKKFEVQVAKAGSEVKCAVAVYFPEKRGAQDSTIYQVGVSERLTVAFHLFIG